MITTKEQIIEYFKSGIKNKKDFKIGIEHEKFLFNSRNNKRVNYSKIKEMFSKLIEFGWNPIFENDNIIGLNKGGKNITLEPGNQIELSGDKLNNIHEACAESYDYLFELKQVTKKLNKFSATFDLNKSPKFGLKILGQQIPPKDIEVKKSLEINNNLENVEEEIGDLLFSVVNLIRHLDLNPDIVVEKSIKKFKNRFLNIEKTLQKNNIKINSKNIHQLWNDAKIKEELNNE